MVTDAPLDNDGERSPIFIMIIVPFAHVNDTEILITIYRTHTQYIHINKSKRQKKNKVVFF